jgi:hypothetical protein
MTRAKAPIAPRLSATPSWHEPGQPKDLGYTVGTLRAEEVGLLAPYLTGGVTKPFAGRREGACSLCEVFAIIPRFYPSAPSACATNNALH